MKIIIATMKMSRTSTASVSTWFITAFRFVCVWKMFCSESNVVAKNLLAIQNTNIPRITSTISPCCVACTFSIIEFVSIYSGISGNILMSDAATSGVV